MRNYRAHGLRKAAALKRKQVADQNERVVELTNAVDP